MNETKDKIKETRFIIFIPLLVTAICAWLDLWLFDQEQQLLTILRTIYTYFFPSIASSMFTLIIQKAVYNNTSCGIADKRVLHSSMFLVIYCVAFVSCLSHYNFTSAIVFGACSIIYMILTWFVCLDKKITHSAKDLVVEERMALKKAIGE